jgi:hypothetical protein
MYTQKQSLSKSLSISGVLTLERPATARTPIEFVLTFVSVATLLFFVVILSPVCLLSIPFFNIITIALEIFGPVDKWQ